jgi:uncharacterized protein with PIN domain
VIYIIKCNITNCIYNENKYCDSAIISEDGYCQTKDIDYNRCGTCGKELIQVKEPIEYLGHETFEEIWICPICG